ncbi:zinc ribbon domain-containing protein [Haloechinothrix sp. YIM 98757]|uniref:Zinc ribbon domain-containing protein n=1 Tax=Haloechinothrix aidingensis TaxID=2752311 RepID=A0A838A9B9_9PSEU|nr:zinc ribbon domain-containing protein [Haloechinothrix aidingensis]MBA0125241.1 zinc ribbon domain-containing protein [Haloechinothrix aidingensis]
MPSYEFHCPDCGIVQRFHRMGAAPATETCPHCGTGAPRVFSAPLLSRTSGRLRSVRERAEESGDNPAITHRRPDRQRNDRHQPPELARLVGKKAASELRQARHPASPSR